MSEAPEGLGKLEWRMDRVEEGVANFRDFQKDAREFFTRADERAKAEKTFHDLRDKENKERMDERHRQNQEKLAVVEAKVAETSAGISRKTLVWNIAGVLVGIAAVIVSLVGIWAAMKMTHTSDLRKLIISEHVRSLYAGTQKPMQDAGSFQPIHY